jgi:hypothetical protein
VTIVTYATFERRPLERLSLAVTREGGECLRWERGRMALNLARLQGLECAPRCPRSADDEASCFAFLPQ